MMIKLEDLIQSKPCESFALRLSVLQSTFVQFCTGRVLETIKHFVKGQTVQRTLLFSWADKLKSVTGFPSWKHESVSFPSYFSCSFQISSHFTLFSRVYFSLTIPTCFCGSIKNNTVQYNAFGVSKFLICTSR